MEKFLLLIRQDLDKVNQMTKEEYQVKLDAMLRWVDDLAKSGNYVSAEPLLTTGSYVSYDGVSSDGPFIEAKEAIGGYFIITANDLDHAAALAQTCPQVISGEVGIEVRPLRIK
ncbi:YciI family protein [Dyadobacter psychrotolerans]|uniref:YCII-related domain-containing protein n=1 Tax=Dyadobacter psychrotolerans TaxID=2541721 RepID=A0A4R5E113_9BACT|nr:YciI family protein [Dyadobacter psychrotolerans]TDE17565.1 hypothetical protein E0F88_06650 [Dyadobacter psychrotolerans]